MARRIVVRQHGPAEVMAVETYTPPKPAPGEALVRQDAIGLNFIDTYYRTGLYAPPAGLPFTPGSEGAGTVVAIGDDVTEVTVGQRVAYSGGFGAYASERTIPARVLVPLPDGISGAQAAAAMLKGITAQYLLRQIYVVQPGDTILIHAAAGGVGSIASQWAKSLGAKVIGTVGSKEKEARARQNGCDHVIVYNDTDDFSKPVREITGGVGVPVVYDGIGKSTFMRSLDCISPRGLMVSFGNASGPVEGVALGALAQRGSLFVTRPIIMHYTATREELLMRSNELFAAMLSGAVKVDVNHSFALDEAADAHRALESRRTTGSTLLIP